MSETLYIDIKQATKVSTPEVYVRDVATITCTDRKIINRVNAIKIWTFNNQNETRYIFSAMKLMDIILKECPTLTISPIGETEFVLEYEEKSKNNKVMEYLKVAFVCTILFFGAGFTIMAFNNDISIDKLFTAMYEKISGIEKPEMSMLEIGYSVGVFGGIIIFYNHFGKKRITKDPTPIEVEMRKYEKDVNTTLIEGINRKESRIDVGK